MKLRSKGKTSPKLKTAQFTRCDMGDDQWISRGFDIPISNVAHALTKWYVAQYPFRRRISQQSAHVENCLHSYRMFGES